MRQQHARNLIGAAALLLPLLSSCAAMHNAAVTEAGNTKEAAMAAAETKATGAASAAAGEIPRAPEKPAVPEVPSAVAQATPSPLAAAAPQAARPSRIKPRHRYVNVRPEPSSDRKQVAVLNGGKRVVVIDEQGNWVKVRWARANKELEGWVFKKYVEGYE